MADPAQAVILIIDDDRLSRRLMKEMLRQDNYKVEFAEDGESGLALARQLQPDLVLLDVVMPGIDGYEVCRRLRQDPMLAEVPVLMLTALEDRDSRLAGIEAGADDFISKPYNVTELRARLRTVVRLNRYRRIRTERDRFGWVVENVEHGYLLIDQQGRLLYANSKARKIFGMEGSDVDLLETIQRQFRLHPPEHWSNWPHLPPGEALHLVRPETSHAPTAWLEVRVLTHSLGRETEVLLQLRDVTTELSSQRSVWTFESLIGHKLRTPLTKITWGLSFISNKADRLSVDKIKEFAALSKAGVDELKAELEEVLGYLNAPSARPGERGFPVGELEGTLNEMVSQLELFPLEVEIQAGLPSTLPIAARAFEMILWELLSNSKKFHPQHQPRAHLTVQRVGTAVVLQLTDDGICLSPEQLRQAFVPYYQGERSFTGQIPGMGLGLSMIRSMLWEISGECSISNRQGQEGLVVELRIPLE